MVEKAIVKHVTLIFGASFVVAVVVSLFIIYTRVTVVSDKLDRVYDKLSSLALLSSPDICTARTQSLEPATPVPVLSEKAESSPSEGSSTESGADLDMDEASTAASDDVRLVSDPLSQIGAKPIPRSRINVQVSPKSLSKLSEVVALSHAQKAQANAQVQAQALYEYEEIKEKPIEEESEVPGLANEMESYTRQLEQYLKKSRQGSSVSSGMSTAQLDKKDPADGAGSSEESGSNPEPRVEERAKVVTRNDDTESLASDGGKSTASAFVSRKRVPPYSAKNFDIGHEEPYNGKTFTVIKTKGTGVIRWSRGVPTS